jgi:hypothetical protein
MTQQSPETFPEADQHKIASAMWNGLKLHAIHHGGDVPLAAYVQGGLDMLPREHAEELGSLYRGAFVDAIAAREPDVGLIEKLRRWAGVSSSTPEHDREIRWITEHARTDSPTMKALLADLLLGKGDKDGAEREYTEALRLVRAQGIAFNE